MDKQLEIWKTLEDFQDYQVSNLGRIKISKLGVQKISKCSLSTKGYQSVSLVDEYKYKRIRIHGLVAIYFIPNPENKKTVNHKNGIKWDNRVENLEWCTHAENNKHAYDIGIKKGSYTGVFGINNPFSKPVAQYKNGILVKIYYAQLEAERITGISSSHISRCCSGQLKTAGGYEWKKL